MGRLLFFVLLAVVAWAAWRLWQGPRRVDAARQERPPAADEVLVECQMCGVRLPKTEALSQHGKFFCCAQHRDEFNATR